MIAKEQIAHDLTIIFLKNRHGTSIDSSISAGHGDIKTKHYPDPRIPKYSSDPEDFFMLVPVQVGYKIEETLTNLVEEYLCTYEQILKMLDGHIQTE